MASDEKVNDGCMCCIDQLRWQHEADIAEPNQLLGADASASATTPYCWKHSNRA
jgi:hypothetical protein